MTRPTETPGPQINGQPSIISLLTPEQLKNYPYLAPLRTLVNAAFISNHAGPVTDYLFPDTLQRLVTDDQLSAELGGNFFTYIVSSPIPEDGLPRLYASASGRLYIPKVVPQGVPEDVVVMQRTGALDLENQDVWELKMLVVDPTLQKQGLASLLMNLVEAEVVRRTAEKRSQLSTMQDVVDIMPNSKRATEQSNGPVVGKKVILTLDTCREINEAYYVRRGFVTTEVKPQRKG
ncbi:hypothetical protein FRB94_014029, partial [Tulasnella sp. JGI-2019a]